MAKKSGGKAAAFGKNHGGADNMKSGLVTSPMSTKMIPKGGKMAGGK
jgi:hypothetical protein